MGLNEIKIATLQVRFLVPLPIDILAVGEK
jgi:hypothetical protein